MEGFKTKIYGMSKLGQLEMSQSIFLSYNSMGFYELKFMLMQSFNKTNSKLILSICKLSDFKIGFQCAKYYLFIFIFIYFLYSCTNNVM